MCPPRSKVALEVVYRIYFFKKRPSRREGSLIFFGAVNDYILVLYVFAIYGLWSECTPVSCVS